MERFCKVTYGLACEGEDGVGVFHEVVGDDLVRGGLEVWVGLSEDADELLEPLLAFLLRDALAWSVGLREEVGRGRAQEGESRGDEGCFHVDVGQKRQHSVIQSVRGCKKLVSNSVAGKG